MDLSLSESELILKDAVQQFVRHEVSRETLVSMYGSGFAWRPEWLDTFASAGWLGLFVPSQLGGTDATVTMAAVLFEELGRGPVPGPVLFSSGVSALLIRAASGPMRDALLSGIATGSEVVIPALQEPGSSWRGASMASADVSDAGRLTCTKVFVPSADTATHFLVSLRPDNGAARCAVVPATANGVRVRGLPGFLQANFEVTFAGVDVTREQLLIAAAEPVADGVLAPALVALAAYQAGGAGAVLDMSVDHANTREQFGVPIGRFQRVQDHIVRILNAADGARWATYEAAWCIDSGRPEAGARAHLAAAIGSESYIEATNGGHEVHAGIGSDPKMGLVLYTQAARSLYQCLGTPDWHRSRMVDALGWAA
jgi:alkylation response protein AidB-like acyl-CoA dehydrogenase